MTGRLMTPALPAARTGHGIMDEAGTLIAQPADRDRTDHQAVLQKQTSANRARRKVAENHAAKSIGAAGVVIIAVSA